MRWHCLLRSVVVLIGAAAVGYDSTVPAHAADPAAVRPQPTDAELLLPPKDEVAALVNDVPILRSEVDNIACVQIAALRPSVLDEAYKREVKTIQTAALERLIDRQVLFQDAEAKLKMVHKENLLLEIQKEAADQVSQRLNKLREKYPTDEEMNAFLRPMHTNLEELNRVQYHMLLAQEYLRGNVMPDIKIDPQEISDYYKAHPDEFRRVDSVEWQDIFIDAAKYPDRKAAYRTANEVASQSLAISSDDFVKLWEKYSNGLANGRKAAGFGTHREDIAPREAAAVLFEMPEGYVGPILEVPAGFHIIRLVKRTRTVPSRLTRKRRKQSRRS